MSRHLRALSQVISYRPPINRGLLALSGKKFFGERLASVPMWLWLGLGAALLRFVNLGQESLWYDEAFTAWLAKLPFDKMLTAIRGDVHPPLWYAVEWVTIRLLGNSEFVLRLPAALLGVACVLMVYRLAILLGFVRTTALIAGLLAAVLPGAIYYSQDARMYDLLTFGVLWMAIAALKGQWEFFTIAGAITVYSQNLGLFYVAAFGLVIVLPRLWPNPHNALKPLMAFGAIGALWAPWLPSLINQAAQVKAGFWMLPLQAGNALMPYFYLPAGWQFPEILQLHAYVAVLGLSLIALYLSRQWLIRWSGRHILAIVLLAPLLMIATSILWRSIYLPRALLPAIFAMLLLWAYTLCEMKRPNRLAALAILIPVLLAGDLYHYWPAQPRFPMRTWMAPIKAQWQADDIIYSLANDGYIMAGYYTEGLARAILPETTDLNQSLTVATKGAMGFIEIPFEELRTRGYRRAWLLASETSLTSRMELDAFNHILAAWPYTTIETYDDHHSKVGLYLVTL